MALRLDHPEADRLARELAEATGEPLPDAVVAALRERLDRKRQVSEAEKERRRRVIREVQAKLAKYPVVDDRPDDELLGYGDDGLPR